MLSLEISLALHWLEQQHRQLILKILRSSCQTKMDLGFCDKPKASQNIWGRVRNQMCICWIQGWCFNHKMELPFIILALTYFNNSAYFLKEQERDICRMTKSNYLVGQTNHAKHFCTPEFWNHVNFCKCSWEMPQGRFPFQRNDLRVESISHKRKQHMPLQPRNK